MVTAAAGVQLPQCFAYRYSGEACSFRLSRRVRMHVLEAVLYLLLVGFCNRPLLLCLGLGSAPMFVSSSCLLLLSGHAQRLAQARAGFALTALQEGGCETDAEGVAVAFCAVPSGVQLSSRGSQSCGSRGLLCVAWCLLTLLRASTHKLL